MKSDTYLTLVKPLLNMEIRPLVDHLMASGLLKPIQRCISCESVLKLRDYTRSIDSRAWVCLTVSCLQYKKYKSIRSNSFFANYRTDLKVLLNLIWKWTSSSNICLSITEIPVVRKTAGIVYQHIRDCCSKYFEQNPVNLGGNGLICQVDESMFRHKPKYHRGRATEYEIWVLGIIDTS